MTDTFRKIYRELTPEEHNLMQEIKEAAEAVLVKIDSVPSGREQALAKTNLEQAVMWAVKAVTG